MSLNFGSLTPEEEHGVLEAIEAASGHAGPFVEIGTLFGFTANLIALHKEPLRELICLDNLSWNPLQLDPAVHRLLLERSLRIATKQFNARLIYADAITFYQGYDGERPALVFIDADHSYDGVRADIDWALERDVPVICGHDYSPQHLGVVRAVQESFGGYIEVRGTVWIAKRMGQRID